MINSIIRWCHHSDGIIQTISCLPQKWLCPCPKDLQSRDNYILTVDQAVPRHSPFQVTEPDHMTREKAQWIACVGQCHVHNDLFLSIKTTDRQTYLTIIQSGYTYKQENNGSVMYGLIFVFSHKILSLYKKTAFQCFHRN